MEVFIMAVEEIMELIKSLELIKLEWNMFLSKEMEPTDMKMF